MHDIEPLRPLLRWINKDHVHKTIAAMQELGADPYTLPNNFFRRNVHDQRRYFEVVLKFSYCNTCKSPRPGESMHTESTCIECHEIKEASWQEVRDQRHARLVHEGATNRYQRNKLKRERLDVILSKPPATIQEIAHVDPSNGERPRIRITRTHTVEDILKSIGRREAKDDGDKQE